MYFKDTYNVYSRLFILGEYLATYIQQCICPLSNVGHKLNLSE